MKKSVKMVLFGALAVAFVVSLMLLSGCSSSSSNAVILAKVPTYTGTLYMATSAGGHIAVFNVSIDPKNTAAPVTVNSASRIQVLDKPVSAGGSNPLDFHDVRFGINALDGSTDYSRIYYSGITSLATDTSVVPIGYVDLDGTYTATNNGVNSTIDITGGADTIAFALSQIADVEFGTNTRIIYCGSGMNKDYYFPMSMSFPAYVDAVPVASLAAGGAHLRNDTHDFVRTWIGQLDDSMNLALWTGVTITIATENGTVLPLNALGVPPLAFIHGGSWTDPASGTTYVYMNTNQMAGLTHAVSTAGTLRAYLVDAADLISESSTTPGLSTMTPAKVLATGTYTVAPSNSDTSADHYMQGTIAYRASFTPDGKYILQSASDRMLVIKASDLSLVADTAGIGNTDTTHSVTLPRTALDGPIASGLGAGTYGGIEVHDVIATPDSKYAILAVRYYADDTHAGGGIKNSGVQIYDIAKKKFIGPVVTTCGECHAAPSLDSENRPTCGIIANLTVN